MPATRYQKPSLAPAFAAMIAGLSLAGCGREGVSTQAQALLEPLTTPAGFEEGPISLTGRVTLKGQPPQPDAVVDSAGDPYCKHHGAIKTENWKVGAGSGLAEAVINVIDSPPTVPAAPPEVTQQGCRYVPHVVAITRGQSLVISNSDKTFHNVRVVRHESGTLTRGTNIINYSQPSAGDRNAHALTESGIFRLECDVHRWMQCWIFVAGNNHLAVSADDGTFAVKRGLRDGTYTVQAWHHHFREPLTQSVTVAEGRGEVNFEFDAALAMN
jgi:plastocyanin